MSEREAFGPNLRRVRVQRGIGLDTIAAATKVSVDLFSGLERNDFSRWPTGIYARAYVRAYALEIGVDPEGTVDDFCRWFPQGDRRVARVVREQAALVGHDSQFKDEITAPSVKRDRRAPRPEAAPEPLPALAFTRTGRIVAAGADLGAVVLVATGVASVVPLGWAAIARPCRGSVSRVLADRARLLAGRVDRRHLHRQSPSAGAPFERSAVPAAVAQFRPHLSQTPDKG